LSAVFVSVQGYAIFFKIISAVPFTNIFCDVHEMETKIKSSIGKGKGKVVPVLN
jgi:ASC-1-like (ASCH) protein